MENHIIRQKGLHGTFYVPLSVCGSCCYARMIPSDVFSADEMLSTLVVLFRAYFPDFSIFCNLNKLKISQFIHLFLKNRFPQFIFSHYILLQAGNERSCVPPFAWHSPQRNSQFITHSFSLPLTIGHNSIMFSTSILCGSSFLQFPITLYSLASETSPKVFLLSTFLTVTCLRKYSLFLSCT